MAVAPGTVKRIGSEARVDKTNGYERALARDAQKQRNTNIAADAATRRSARTGRSIVKRVEAARKVLRNRSFPDTLEIINSVNPMDRDVYLIASTETQSFGKHVLRRYGAIRKSVLAQYRDESGVQAPDSTER